MRERIERVEDLEVFRRAYRLSLEIHKSSLELPRIEQFALADQLRRSSKSICANLAEGFAKQSYSAAEYRRYLTVAIGSSDETQLWLRYCIDLGYIEEVVGRRWHGRLRRDQQDAAGSLRQLVAFILIPDSWFLTPGVVAERSVGRRRWRASAAGGIGSANADMSSDKQREKRCRRKSKGSCARLIRAGLAGPLRRGREP